MKRVAMICVVFALVGGCTDDGGSAAAPSTTRPVITPWRAETVSHAIERMVATAEAGLMDHLWLDLDPAQQAVIPQSLFVQCETDLWRVVSGSRYVVIGPPARVTRVRPWPVAGTNVARDLVMQVDLGLDKDGGRIGNTLFFSQVDGRWRWIASEFAVTRFQSGACSDLGYPSFI